MTKPKTEKVYIVVSDFGSAGCAYNETDERYTDRETLVRDLIDAQFTTPIRVVAFDPKECDVSAEIARDVVERAWTENVDLTDDVIDFCEDHGVDVPEIVHR